MKKNLIVVGVLIVLAVFAFFAVSSNNKSEEVAKPVATKTYVAMGDSVAAGVGLNYDSDSSACDRTDQSYPHQLAALLNYKLTNLACSGATINRGINGMRDVNKLSVKPQVEQLFEQSKPDLITLTIGANDVDWTGLVAQCYVGICGTPTEQVKLSIALSNLHNNLEKTLSKIKTEYKTSPPRVIVTGYHQLFPAKNIKECTDITDFDASELSWGRSIQSSLNKTLKDTVGEYSFATFGPIDFTNHELCTSDPWVQGIGDKKPYHPTEEGQKAFATQTAAITKKP